MLIRIAIDGKEYEGTLSEVAQTGSIAATTICKAKPFEPFTDKRDGQTYKCIHIGNQVWMAQNLNYEIDGSYCYDNNPEQGELYGRLYSWAVALGVCPLGWHLPSVAEWQELAGFIGEQSAATALKSVNGWAGSFGGTDEYNFAALPAGYRSEGDRDFHYLGKLAGWWTSSDFSHDKAYSARLHSNVGQIQVTEFQKMSAFSIRCVKD